MQSYARLWRTARPSRGGTSAIGYGALHATIASGRVRLATDGGAMSAFGGKADVAAIQRNVCF